MLEPEEKKELLIKLKEKKDLVRDLRSKLNEINIEKEKCFHEKDKISSEIRNQISMLKDAKENRDKLTGVVKKSKESRDELNNAIKAKIEELKKYEQERDAIVKKHNIRGDPAMIKKEIERLEFQYETSVMSFDKEKEFMSKIKELKKRYEQVGKVSTVWKKIHDVSMEIEKLKQEANQFHKQIQTNAGQSQEKHEVLIESSKVIKDQKKSEKDLQTKFLEQKAKFNELNITLKKELEELNQIYTKLDMNRDEAREVRKESQRKTLAEKRKEAEDKMKRGEKLTTEDILAFQGTDDGED